MYGSTQWQQGNRAIVWYVRQQTDGEGVSPLVFGIEASMLAVFTVAKCDGMDHAEVIAESMKVAVRRGCDASLVSHARFTMRGVFPRQETP